MNKTIILTLPALTLAWSATGSATSHADHHSHADSGHWEAPVEESSRQNPITPDRASVERGKQLFQTHCTGCHGPTGKGDGPVAAALTPRPANLVTMAPNHSDGDLAWKIAEGRNSMPGWRNALKPDEIWDLVTFIRQLPQD